MTRLFFLVAVFLAVLLFILLGIMPASAQPQLQEPHQEDEPTATPQPPVPPPPPDESQQEGRAQDTPEPTIDWANIQMEGEGSDSVPQAVESIPTTTVAPESAAPAPAPAPSASGGESSPPSNDVVPTPVTQGMTHVVQSGETLYLIAQRYGISVTQLMTANNIQDPRRLQAGQVLIIPGPGSNVDVPVAAPQEGEAPPVGEVYTVQRGDSLFEIARRFGVSIQALIAANGLANPDRIDAGQTLTIPRGGGAPVVQATPAPTIVAEVPATPVSADSYVVQRGDNLYRIAQRFGVSVQALIAANNLASPDRIDAGQTLIIPHDGSTPAVAATPVSTTVAEAPSAPESAVPDQYVVQRGDGFYRIARRFGVSVEALVAANNLTINDRIDPGQTLIIPREGDPPPAPATPAPATVDEAPAAPESAAPDRYVVQRGDGFYRIAERFGVPVQALVEANGLTINDRLDPGQTLIIPHKGDPPPAPETPVPSTPTEAPATPVPTTVPEEPATPGSAGVYVVKRGDSFYRIARRYGVSAQALAEANNLTINDRIDPGQTLIIPDGTANSSLERSAAVQPEAQLISLVAQGTAEGTPSPAASGSLFIWPIPLEVGWIPKWYRADHPGIDIILPTGTPIQAAASGTVEFSGWNNYGFGNLVVINHGNGYRTLYAHQSQRLVEEGDTVGQGEVIGLVGMTGRATDPHLHFEIRQPYTPANPCYYLPGGCQ